MDHRYFPSPLCLPFSSHATYYFIPHKQQVAIGQYSNSPYSPFSFSPSDVHPHRSDSTVLTWKCQA